MRSRSESPALGNVAKTEEAVDSDQQQKSQQVEGASSDAIQGGVARSEEAQAAPESEKQKSKKKKHHRRDHQDNYNNQPPTQGIPFDNNPYNRFQQVFPSQQPAYFGDYQAELPAQLKVNIVIYHAV